METITTYKERALNSLQMKWGSAVLATFVYLASFMVAMWVAIGIILTPILIVLSATGIFDFNSLFNVNMRTEEFNSSDTDSLSSVNAFNTDAFTDLMIKLAIIYVIYFGVIILVQLLVSPPFTFGIQNYFKRFVEKGETGIGTVYSGFKMYFKAFKTILAVSVFTWLWSLLFIIPGIIAAIRYSQTVSIVLDNPEIGVFDAMQKSSEMMNGYKLNYFLMQLSFIGWSVLSSLICGIGYLFLIPYMLTTDRHFYNSIKNGVNISGNPQS